MLFANAAQCSTTLNDLIPICTSTVYYAKSTTAQTIFMTDIFYKSTYGCVPRSCFSVISLTPGCISTINLKYKGNGISYSYNVDKKTDGYAMCDY